VDLERLEKALLEAPPDVIIVARIDGLVIVDGSHPLFFQNDLGDIPKDSGVWRYLDDPKMVYDASSGGD
jgi:hypothetical protein